MGEHSIWWRLLAGILLCLPVPYSVVAETDGNCLMCHKYPGLGRFDETRTKGEPSTKHVYYINNTLFEKTYHGSVRCQDCHNDISRIPHDEVKKVDCSTNCHVIDPSSGKRFSHQKIVNDFNNSVHGKNSVEDTEGLPVCKDCHSNKPYHVNFDQHLEAMTFLKVCDECHESGAFTQRFYEHISYRISKRRSSREVVRLCGTCHADRKLMEKYGLDVVVGFSNTFHAKALSYGNTEVPNCLNCHAPYQLGFSPHRITSQKSPDSPTHPDNRLKTCSQVGCHTQAGRYFTTGGYVHPSTQKVALSASATETASDAQERIHFENQVIEWIQWFYRILIPLVIFGLGGHRLLLLYADWRYAKKENFDHE